MFYKYSSGFKKENVNELIYKFGANFARDAGSGKHFLISVIILFLRSADKGQLLFLLQFYRGISDYYCDLFDDSVVKLPSYMAWTQNFARLAEKVSI
jgi:hypothetical protein